MQTIGSYSRRAVVCLGQMFKRLTVAAIIAATFGGATSLGPSALADPNQAKDCVKVGGAFVTNFIADDQTAGTATGDLKGALGVKVLAVVSGAIGDGKPVSLKVQHFWVTETGDTIIADQAILSAYPGKSPSRALLYTFVYENGIKIAGGTGKFESATGLIDAWGAVDLGAGEVVGRYSGTICFKNPKR